MEDTRHRRANAHRGIRLNRICARAWHGRDAPLPRARSRAVWACGDTLRTVLVRRSYCAFVATWLACRGLPIACRRSGHFSLRAQRKVTKRNGLAQPGVTKKLGACSLCLVSLL